MRARRGASQSRRIERRAGFNGAALVRARRVSALYQSRWCRRWLQRSRARESAEGSSAPPKKTATAALQRSRARESAEGSLGMFDTTPNGPLQRSRARESAEGPKGVRLPRMPRHRFNGAALVRARRDAFHEEAQDRIGALQRSRARESAEGRPMKVRAMHEHALQRSRARESAEGLGAVVSIRPADTLQRN